MRIYAVNTSLFLLLALFVVFAQYRSSTPDFDAEVSFQPDGSYLPSLISDIYSASDSISIAIYIFKTDYFDVETTVLLKNSLIMAAERGVDVYVVFDAEEQKDSFVNKVNRATGEDLKKHGVEVRYNDQTKRLHSKVVVIDGLVVYIGSHNFTYSAMRRNHEASVRIISEELAEDIHNYIRGLK